MKTKQLLPPNPKWTKPLLFNDAYVLGYDTDLDVKSDIDLLIVSGPPINGQPQLGINFWCGGKSAARIEEFINTRATRPDSDVIIWRVCLAWLYEFIHLRRHSLQYVIGSFGTDGSYTLYEPQVAMQVLRKFHSYSQGLADGFRKSGLDMPVVHSELDEKVRLTNVVRELSKDYGSWEWECPVECPSCDRLVKTDELLYIAWRDGELRRLACPACNQDILETPFRAAKCAACHRLTGLMPMSMADAIDADQIPDFRCSQCISIWLGDRPNEPVPEPNQKQPVSQTQGCLVLLTLISAATCYCIALLTKFALQL